MRQLLFPGHPAYWFETVRSMSHIAYGAADFSEVLTTADRIIGGDPDSWHDEWRATADRIVDEAAQSLAAGHQTSARDGYLRASNYYRNTEFFLHGDPADPRILDNYERAVAAFAQYAALVGPGVLRPISIPFEDYEMPGYFYPSPLPGPRALLVLHNGFDGSVEELHAFGAIAARERGYHVLTFDGPGQPGTRHRQGVVFRPDWEKPVGAVIDWATSTLPQVDASRIALQGVSLGGLLCLRAAAFESRLAAVIAVDGVYDFGASFTAAFGGADRAAIERIVLAEHAPEADAALGQLAATDSTARWGLEHGRYVMGGDTPRAFLARALEYHLHDGIAESITCPALICEAEGDMFFTGQPEQVYGHLTTQDRTLMRFGADEGADLHCHMGAQRHALARIYDWLDERLHP
jgi:hypothetical protein